MSIWGIPQILLLKYLHMHCALHYSIYYAITTSSESLITHRLLKTFFHPFALKTKHLYSYTYNDSNHVFLYICVRMLIESIIRPPKIKLIHVLLFLKWTKRCFISYILFIGCTVMHLYSIDRADERYITCRSLLEKEYLFCFYSNF